MPNITTDDIQRDLVKFLCQVEAGETLVIFGVDQAIAELKPIAKEKQLWPFGLCVDDFTVPAGLDTLLLEDLLITFEGK